MFNTTSTNNTAHMIVSREISIDVSEGRGEIHPSTKGDIVIVNNPDPLEGRSEIHPSTKGDIVIISSADVSEGRGEIHPSSNTKTDVTRDNRGSGQVTLFQINSVRAPFLHPTFLSPSLRDA